MRKSRFVVFLLAVTAAAAATGLVLASILQSGSWNEVDSTQITEMEEPKAHQPSNYTISVTDSVSITHK